MLFRLLRLDENLQNGLSAKDPNSGISVLTHVINGGKSSKYISTCGSLSAVLEFKSHCVVPGTVIVKILDEKLPVDVVKIDLRTPADRLPWYTNGPNCGELNYKFDNFSSKFEEVLIDGYVPNTLLQLLTRSDFPPGACPEWLNYYQ